MRLAFIGDPNSIHTRRWMDYYLERGHDVHLLVPAQDPLTAELDRRIRLHRFRAWPRTGVPGLGRLVTAAALRLAMRRIRPDVLHAHCVTRYGLAAWLTGFHPYVLTVWGTDVLIEAKANDRLRRNARRALRAADLVTGGSGYLVDAAIEAGARPERTRYVHFGVDTEVFCPGPDPAALRARLGLKGKRVLLSPRNIAPLYHQRTVVEALAALPPDVAVVMTRHSAQPEELAAVESRAAEHGVSDRVVIVDAVAHAEMPDFYRLADVVLSVPASDGGPNTIVEALASGRPIVASDLAPAREWLGELDPETLVPVGDAAATAKAIGRVLARSPRERDERARRGRAAVEERADQRRTIAAMEQAYRQLASGRRRS